MFSLCELPYFHIFYVCNLCKEQKNKSAIMLNTDRNLSFVPSTFSGCTVARLQEGTWELSCWVPTSCWTYIHLINCSAAYNGYYQMSQKKARKHAGDLMYLPPKLGLYSFLIVTEFFKLSIYLNHLSENPFLYF